MVLKARSAIGPRSSSLAFCVHLALPNKFVLKPLMFGMTCIGIEGSVIRAA
jgi:hypothetical protein